MVAGLAGAAVAVGLVLEADEPPEAAPATPPTPTAMPTAAAAAAIHVRARVLIGFIGSSLPVGCASVVRLDRSSPAGLRTPREPAKSSRRAGQGGGGHDRGACAAMEATADPSRGPRLPRADQE